MKATKDTPAAAAPAAFTGLVVRDKHPENLEFPFASLNSAVTPNEQFFVRSHFPVPKLSERSWRLRVEGLVERPLELCSEGLREFPRHHVTATLECAGNSRIFLHPKVGGLQWELGAVGNARWSGVSLAAVLERAGLKPGAVEVVLEGADSGEIKKEPVSPGKIQYARGLPVAKALDLDVILATHMNGEPLPVAHGFPLRAVVSDWYGMASVKWLTRILVSDRDFRGYFESSDYTYWKQSDGLPIQLLPLSEVEVKAQIARPTFREIVPANSVYRVHGAAWTGNSVVTRVEISTNGGRSWKDAQLLGDSVRHAWRLWEYHWRTPARPGACLLMARATDARGRVQPMTRDNHRGTYMVTHVQPIEVEVRPPKGRPADQDSYAI